MAASAKKRRIRKNEGIAGGPSCNHASTEDGTAISLGYDYEVFLSFRGPDTRPAFTDFLYTSLNEVGIRTFKDDEMLRVGEEFEPKLLQAINQSKISIPIFSKGYASSVWCLKELVQMVKCQETGRQKIKPIFYDVDPSVVRHQTGNYAKAFLSHEKKGRYDRKTISQWKAALKEVSSLSGWDLHSKKKNRREGEFAKTVTQEVFNELKKANLVVSDCLVCVDNHVNAIMKMIGSPTSETRIIGIYGMGGTGKTTIAKMIYNELSNNFQNCCFLSNIREMSERKGIESLQHQLISDILKDKRVDIKNMEDGTKIIQDRLSTKKVLLLLDDVDHKKHMDALVGKRDWFGIGSNLIITTRNKEVLKVPEVDDSYKVNGMNDAQSLQLFSKHAFKKDYPSYEYIHQSKRAIDIAGGLPLALEVIGSLLWHTEEEMWDATLKMLESVPRYKVLCKLKISYDALDFRQKRIFLDIACLFIGYDKDILVHFWDESIFFPEEAMKVLQNMSLIKINEDNEVWMHDQLRDLGREMVREKSDTKIKKQSRVWDPKEGLNLLRRHKGKKKVEGLRLKLDHRRRYRFTCDGFENLSDLRFLEVDSSMENFCAEERLLWHESPSNAIPTNEDYDLLPQLRWLSWHDIPPTFNITNFSMEDVVILDLSRSKIMHDWKGWNHMQAMENLKVLNLTDCQCLGRTPNFSCLANLERLILRGCRKLRTIHESIHQLKNLVYLDVRHCRNLQTLPEELGGLEALKELRIDLTSIEEIPNCQEMRNLRTFTASYCGIITIHPSIGNLASLEYLSLKGCKSLAKLPDSIGSLELLIELDISETEVRELPDSIGNLKNLKVMKMSRTLISTIPNALWTIEKLKEIEAEGKLPFHVKIGNCIYRNQSLRILRLKDAKICVVPRLPESLTILVLDTLYTTFPDLSNLINLRELDMRFSPHDYDRKSHGLVEGPIPRWIGKLSKMESWGLESDYVTTVPKDISLLPKLKALALTCSNLHCLPMLPSSLLSLTLHSCHSLPSMDLSNLKKLSSLRICFSAISEIQGLDCLENLINLELGNCGNMVEIQGKLQQSLAELRIYSCESLQKLPDLSSLKGLEEVVINDCMKLNVKAILGYARRNWRISGSNC
ncbi:hypothetical protein ACJRO7_032316 [Eucalyptus globulus]|uniref:TIR domain-containing protein n=1 Tax=Eucalyptus globulus TaxID=34317 RepID=A0ABD3JMJ4_EUCGL